MSFVCTLVEGEFHPDALRRGDGYLVIVPIGYDDEEDLLYSLWVMLGPQAGGRDELSFFVNVEDGDGNEIEQIWSSYTARSRFDAEARRLITINLLLSINSLLRIVNPPAVFMCSMAIDREGKAMRKYLLVAREFQMCGYDVGKFDQFEGQCVWRMDRAENLGVDTIHSDMTASGVTGVDDDEPR